MVAFYGLEMKREKFCYIIGLNKTDLMTLALGKSINIDGKCLKTDKDFIIYSEKDDKALFDKMKYGIDKNTQFTYKRNDQND